MSEYKEISHHSLHNPHTISTLVNDKRFYSLTELGEHTAEVQSTRPVTKLNVPVQIGFMCLDYSKKLLLSFYYSFIVRYLQPDSYCLIEADTDSVYMGIAAGNIHQIVKPDMKEEYVADYENWMAREYCDTHKPLFFKAMFKGETWKQKDCCESVARYYKREGGLFHIEHVSQGCVALCSKSYYCFGDNVKFSAKGVNRSQNNLSEDVYKDVLFNQNISLCTNKGFQKKNESVYTYIQTKKGLNYMYCKRIVCPDHITTLPTDL